MDFFDSMNTSASALAAQRTRLNVISNNIANANTTRTPAGGPYRKQQVIFSEVLAKKAGQVATTGVAVSRVQQDQSPPKLQYDPSHPDANAQGYVALPNINTVEEMTDMITATRAYEANVTAMQASKAMAMKTLELGSR